MQDNTQVHYNKQRLEDEIEKLARQQEYTLDSKPLQPIDAILSTARKTLTDTYRVLARAARKNRELSVAGEWLIDNFYIVQEQIVQLKEDLPVSYYKKLPRLKSGSLRGYPRIYEPVVKLASLSDNIIDRDNTGTVVQAYQRIETLKLGELWAIPIMIRLVLITRLAERSEQLLQAREIKNEAAATIDELLQLDLEEPGIVLRKLADIYDKPGKDRNFLIALARQLQNRGALTETERNWFNYKFRSWNTTLEEQLRAEAQETSRLHLSIQNAIMTLRQVSETDWSDFVEKTSVVERILRLDPSGYYGR
ncbi:MAG: glycosyltransferase 36, partial [Balneolaceae bacterium]|nr:glycosyltransferase 36 [Balneolaceae bacterium]